MFSIRGPSRTWWLSVTTGLRCLVLPAAPYVETEVREIAVAADAPHEPLPDWIRENNEKVGQKINVGIAEWIVRTLDGRPFGIVQSINFLREAASAEQDFLTGPAVGITVAAYIGGRPWLGEITNAQPVPNWFELRPKPCFDTSGDWAEGSGLYLAGEKRAVSSEWIERLRELSDRKPREPKEFLRLLIALNKQASKDCDFGKVISPECQAMCVTADGRGGGTINETYGKSLPHEALGYYSVWRGIGMLLSTRELQERFRRTFSHLMGMSL
jgi:hypothetical protein